MKLNKDAPVYSCEECGYCASLSRFDGHYDKICCPECGSLEIEFKEYAKASYVSIAEYTVERAYGGPEEGGWWYDHLEIDPGTLRCFEDSEWPQAEMYWETAQARVKHANDRRVCFHLDMIVMQAPKKRPQYS